MLFKAFPTFPIPIMRTFVLSSATIRSIKEKGELCLCQHELVSSPLFMAVALRWVFVFVHKNAWWYDKNRDWLGKVVRLQCSQTLFLDLYNFLFLFQAFVAGDAVLQNIEATKGLRKIRLRISGETELGEDGKRCRWFRCLPSSRDRLAIEKRAQ